MNLARLRVPSLDGLLAFEAAARYGTFERAAEVLCITGSAAAKRVAAVEQLLGVQLLDRSGKTLVLTDIGREYLQQVAGPLRLLAAVPLHQSDEKRKARLRVCAPPTFARQIVATKIHEFTSRHACVDLELVLSTPYPGSPSADTDCVFGAATPSKPAARS